MSEELAQLEEELAEVTAKLAADPSNAELIESKADLEEMVNMTKEMLEIDQEVAEIPSEASNIPSEEAAPPPPPPPPQPAAPVAPPSKKRKIKTASIVDPNSKSLEPLPIPENLTVLPTDSAEEAAKKRKKLKFITNQNRLRSKERARNQKVAGWQSFVTKGSKKKKKGVGRTSMFRTPASASGKVGVVNSGKGVTAPAHFSRVKPATK